MKTKIYILIILLFTISGASISAQKVNKKIMKVELSAKIVDEAGNPLPGVNVSANENAVNAVTDSDGNFTLKLKKGSIISFDYVGYKKLTLRDRDIANMSNIVVMCENELMNVFNDVNLAYQTKKQYKTTGAVSVVNPNEELEKDYRTNISAAVGGKVPGMSGLNNLHGLGSGAITVVDGIIQDVDCLTLQEVESITVLKDAVSRMLYGAEGDQGVVLIKTKRGESNKKYLNFNAEFGFQKAIAYPNYLDAASYMETYNQASMNDGGGQVYGKEMIDNTRSHMNSLLYPDNNYYSNLWVKDVTDFSNIYGETSGGNDKVNYYVNMGWKRNDGWLKNAESDVRNVLYVSGKVDFKVNDWLKMHTDISTVFDINKTANVDDVLTNNFWKKSTTFLPNTVPLLIPVSSVNNIDDISGVHLIDGQYLMGGTSVYQDNLLGDLTQRGSITTMNRILKFKTGFDINMNKITKGLSAHGAINFEFNNVFSETIANNYAIYELTSIDDNNMFSVIKHGNDKITTSKSVSDANTLFSRNFSGYVSLNYARTFGDHDISVVLMGYGKQYRTKDLFQEDRRLSSGLQLGYTYKNRYLLEAGALCQGSKKMNPDKRWGVVPSFGIGWIITDEKFMKDASWIDYLKLRSSFGIIENDNWADTYGNYKGYFLYEPIYQSSNAFSYNNGASKNNSILISSIGNDYSWQKREEFTIGFDSYLFNHKIWLEASYFNSKTKDMLVAMNNTNPLTMGGVSTYANYNSTRFQGAEIGMKYLYKANDFSMNIGVNYMYTTSEVLKNEEPIYDSELNKHLTRVGAKNNAMYALEADGLYSVDDFNVDGTLKEGMPISSYGTVQPGDIKYIDYNKDGIINDNDVHDLGYISGNNHLISANLNFEYKNWQFFALVSGAFGGKGWLNSNYYWFKGNQAKYSEFALKAYSTDNPDVNAECPRLTLGNGTNNYRNSSFWLYDRSNISLQALQLGYTFNLKPSSFIRNMKVYVRGSNLLTIAKDKDVLEMNVGTTPQSRLLSLGLITSF